MTEVKPSQEDTQAQPDVAPTLAPEATVIEPEALENTPAVDAVVSSPPQATASVPAVPSEPVTPEPTVVLSPEEKRHKTRTLIVREIISTEESYVASFLYVFT